MTKKSAIGAAVAALALAAGSVGAHAAPSEADANIMSSTIIFADVNPDTTSPHTSWWIDLATSDSNPASLEGLTLVGCVGADREDPFVFVQFSDVDVVPGTGIFRIGPQGYTGPSPAPDVTSDAPLDSEDYDLRLVDFGTFPATVVAHAANGNPNQDCVDSLPPITP